MSGSIPDCHNTPLLIRTTVKLLEKDLFALICLRFFERISVAFLLGIVLKLVKSFKRNDSLARTLTVQDIVDIDKDALQGLHSLVAVPCTICEPTYIHTLWNGLWRRIDSAETAQLLPALKTGRVTTKVRIEFGIE